MKYKHIVRIAQLVFLVVVPKKMIHASSSYNLVYDGEEFNPASVCESVQKTGYPFYVVKRSLYKEHAQILLGSLVTLQPDSDQYNNEKNFKIIKNQVNTDTLTGSTQTLPLEYVDIPTNWNFFVLQSKNTPFELNNKTLQLEVSGNKMNYRRCCTQSKCVDLPVFTVSESGATIGKIAFSPSASDFISSYTARKNTVPATTAVKRVVPQKVETVAVDSSNTHNTPVNIPSVTTPQQKVICTKSSPLRIYNESLQTVLYNAPRFLPVKVFQSWEGGPTEKTVKGHALVKVQVSNGSGKEITGWAAETFIKPASECSGMPLIYSKDGEEGIPGATVVVDSPANCCRFPTLNAPSSGYNQGDGKRYFGAVRRSGKRKHAAADLLRPTGEKVLAIDGGKVLRKYHFYAGTYAVEVKHDSGYVARYGEVAPQNVAQSGPGERVIKGQHIGNIGSLRMLHFEIYSDKVDGPLTQLNNGEYWRRSDLLNPTPLLNKWQEMTF
ncbi:MAG: M23 family metallopeptidase [Bdellovibrionaceae bacterium]|nr:M23 family metallopeptidase [Pseudobdellovibrionaceae bacterium]